MNENEVNGIHQYVRNDQKTPIGVLAAVEVEGRVGIAASMCNPKDHFDPKLGVLKARCRAEANAKNGKNRKLPFKVANSPVVTQFKIRAEKFFKDKEIVLDFEE